MIEQLAPQDLPAWIAAQKASGDLNVRVTVLDCREAWELQTASIPIDGFEFKHIPMNDTPARMGELDANAPIAVLCHHGMRSQRVAQYLVQNGFSTVANITGGIAAWSRSVDISIPQY